jgi:hypothetical protein
LSITSSGIEPYQENSSKPSQLTWPLDSPLYRQPTKLSRSIENSSITLIAYGIIDCVIFFYLGLLSFNLVSDPLDSLDQAGIIAANSTINQMFGPIIIYFIFMAFYGVIQIILTKDIKRLNWVAIFLLTCGPAISIAMFVGFFLLLIPWIRGLLIVAPLLGDIWIFHIKALECFPGKSSPIKKTLSWFKIVEMIFIIALTVLIELFLTQYQTFGAIIMYVGFISIGLVLLFESMWIYNMASQLIFQVSSVRSIKSNTGIGFNVIGTNSLKHTRDNTLLKTIGIFIIVSAICFIIFKPAIEKYYIEPELVIQKAELSKDGIVDVIIINKAGSVAIGKIQLWLNNSTISYLLDQTNRVDGFGKWVVSKDIGGKIKVDTYFGLNLSLSLNGMTIKNTHIHYPQNSECMIPVSFIALVSYCTYAIKPKARRRSE